MPKLKDKVAVITGTDLGDGLGHGQALLFVDGGVAQI